MKEDAFRNRSNTDRPAAHAHKNRSNSNTTGVSSNHNSHGFNDTFDYRNQEY
jgi:hypothetical protein